jgi:cell division septation protein DedD
MVSEEVLLEVQGGKVEATFVMRNQGDEQEAFDVWFPLSDVEATLGDLVRDFHAWIDGVPAEVSEIEVTVDDVQIPWATWPVTFPPGQDVVLRVTYAISAVGERPYHTFHYVLETGAGWWGTIGQGTITYRLPYEVNETNAVLGGARPDWFTVSGSDVVWQFTDLEPTADDNVRLTVLSIPVYQELVAAREAADPDDVASVIRLARAAEAGLYYRYGLIPIGNSEALVEEVDAAYLRALELSPEDIDLYVEYLDWLIGLPPPGEPVSEKACPVLARVMQLAPDHRGVIGAQRWIARAGPCDVPMPATATPTATRTPTPVPTSTVSPTPTATPTSTAEPTPTASPTPTETPTSTATATTVPAPTPSATALPTATAVPQPTRGRGPCASSMVVLGSAAILVPWAVLAQRRQ